MTIGGSDDRFARQRAAMVADQLVRRGVKDPVTLAAMGRVPRERFVPASLADRAYEDGALGIGGGQTISQPYIVARMTEALDLGGWASEHGLGRPVVLDVGTGSGYQAAVLAEGGAKVVSIERDEQLADEARDRLRDLGYDVDVLVGDGSAGWPERSPYAGIVVAAAAPDFPAPLIEQLDEDGRLVIPIGGRHHQELVVARRQGDRIESRHLEPAIFVPLVGRYGFPESDAPYFDH
jgi:protein-L-isoaspartate(D-aspartate) O-methyltransferase